MFKNRPQLKRDLLLIGSLIIIVVGVLIFSFATRKKAEVAIVKYENKTLFEVDLNSGKLKVNTDLYKAPEMPEIVGEDLFIAGEKETRLEFGKGVINYNNFYVIKGRLGYVLIEYNPEKKMIRVKQETSPYNICSNQGYSNNAPIICLPNYVFINFSKAVEVDGILG
ncbi:MAG: hypothetical protein GX149_02075 [Acholeplasmataceae bacterium]|jgi:hypothetical protein|nr:hypothetical protein [Acholeplasmataceae bacterium]